ncbi:MAG: endonuclease VIII [Burkholderiales bacterium]|nr:endonuclease VIII [Rhodocyclaceae bacterium]MCA3021564.1 endonuclease VIII [Rhodocyclaceae bacterium]MCA3052695.1 endonuclease VIII [Rhodocyclaceae bacterium]
MPEGPEIKRAADSLAAALVGKRALLVEFAALSLYQHGRALTGKTILDITPRGKAMLTQFEGGKTIYSHNQLYGEWDVIANGARPHPTKQIRLAIHTDAEIAILYSASSIEVLPTARIGAHNYIQKLGVELLDDATTEARVLAHIEQPRFGRKSLAGLLLDQAFLAGVGNYLRSEILFIARITPNASMAELNRDQRRELAQAALALSRQSYQTAGITNDLTLADHLRRCGWAFGRYRHWVFDRDGEPCHICKTKVQRQNLGGRGIYWCPSCQSGRAK